MSKRIEPGTPRRARTKAAKRLSRRRFLKGATAAAAAGAVLAFPQLSHAYTHYFPDRKIF